MTFDAWLISRLTIHGTYAGIVDAVPGRQMTAALRRFQGAVKLPITGLADQATVDALRLSPNTTKPAVAAPKFPAEPVWMREARRYMGLKEIVGPASNATIMSWARRAGKSWIASFYTNDDIPWCGLFVNNAVSVTLPKEVLLANPLSALAWAKFGIELTVPVVGAILVFKRPGGGHVGFYVGEDATHYYVLGGNQSNSVSITRIAKERLVAIRYPRTGGDPVGGRVKLTVAGAPVSSNEA
mgnify:FL=1